MKRPLFVVCLLVVAVIWIRLMMGGYEEVPTNFFTEGSEGIICGQVCQIEKNKVWLNSVKILDVNQIFQMGDKPDSTLKSVPFPKKIICDYPEDAELKLGSVVVLSGYMESIPKATNPGEFDYSVYYRSYGATAYLKKTKLKAQGEEYWYVRNLAFRIRGKLGDRLATIFPTTEAGIMSALLLGDKTELDREMKDLYKRNGILHILSISSLHITVLGMSFYKLLRKVKVPIMPAALLGNSVLLFYGALTGFGISACRAIGMYMIRMTAKICGRTYDMLTALGIMAAFMVWSNPFYLQNSGFLLSYGAILGIGVLYPYLRGEKVNIREKYYGEKKYRVIGRKIAHSLWDTFLANVSVMAVTLPVQLWFYYEVPISSFLINPFILPLIKPLLMSGIFSLLPGCSGMGVIAIVILKWIQILCRLTDKLQFRNWNPGRPDWRQICLYYLLLISMLLFFYCIKKYPLKKKIRQSRKQMIALSILMGACCILEMHFPRETKVLFLDVGQGDCTLIMTKTGENYLIDCGSSSKRNVGSYVLLPCLKYYGVHQLDGIFLTHPDTDHMNGIIELAELAQENGIEPKLLYLPALDLKEREKSFEEVLNAFDTKQMTEIRWIAKGDEILLKEGKILSLHPPQNADAEDTNVYSQCLLVDFGGVSLLLTGDVEGKGEEELQKEIKKHKISDITILKCAHHGSRYSSSEEFLKTISPRMTVISCGQNNSYGHPHKETLARLQAIDTKVMRTDECGAILVSIKNQIFIRFGRAVREM